MSSIDDRPIAVHPKGAVGLSAGCTIEGDVLAV